MLVYLCKSLYIFFTCQAPGLRLKEINRDTSLFILDRREKQCGAETQYVQRWTPARDHSPRFWRWTYCVSAPNPFFPSIHKTHFCASFILGLFKDVQKMVLQAFIKLIQSIDVCLIFGGSLHKP